MRITGSVTIRRNSAYQAEAVTFAALIGNPLVAHKVNELCFEIPEYFCYILNMSYLYETHLHTSESSACGVSRGKEYIERYLDLGYSGVIITDHFIRGNCAADRNLLWERWVEQFCRGFEDAREEGRRRGLDVFFGWEETFDGDDYLVYGLDKQWLLKHPEARRWSRKEQFEEVRRYGGCVVQAHPFRQQHYIDCIHLSAGCVDAVEAANGGNNREENVLALGYAQKLHLPFTAGSDIHNAKDIDKDTVFGVYLNEKMETIADYVSAIHNNAISALHVPAGYLDTTQMDTRVSLPVDIRDSQDMSTGESLGGFFKKELRHAG